MNNWMQQVLNKKNNIEKYKVNLDIEFVEDHSAV
jgi:hypothetical protein